MLRIIAHGLESDVGWRLTGIDRFTKRYSEGGRSLTLSIEFSGTGDRAYVYWREKQFWDEQCETSPLTTADRARIRANLREAFGFSNVKAVFDDE